MSMRASTVALALAAAMTALAPAAAAQNSKKVPDAPLDFDPARPERVDGWWTNGSELLRLEPNGAYRLWPTEDRFMRPAEVGAWRRDNYVFFDLEPYGAKPGTRFRVMMRKQEGRTELQRDGLAAFRQIASPPRVFGDEMLGAWGSTAEELLILDTGRYEWRRVGKAPGISAHSGQWMTDGESLTIAPDIDSVASLTLRAVRQADGSFALEGPNGGRLTRPAPTQPAPAADAAPGAAAAPAQPPAPAATPPPPGAPAAEPVPPAPASGGAPAAKP
jgi:hypothetical protein